MDVLFIQLERLNHITAECLRTEYQLLRMFN